MGGGGSGVLGVKMSKGEREWVDKWLEERGGAVLDETVSKVDGEWVAK